jgi:hypothetical protein
LTAEVEAAKAAEKGNWLAARLKAAPFQSCPDF